MLYILGESLVLDYKQKIIPYLMGKIFSAWLEIGECHLVGFFTQFHQTYLGHFCLILWHFRYSNSAGQLQKKIVKNEWSFISEKYQIKAWVYLTVLLTLSWPSNYHQMILYGVITHNQMFIWLLKQ